MIKEEEIRIGNWFHHNWEWSYRSDNSPESSSFNFRWNSRDWYALGECTMDLENVFPIDLGLGALKLLGFVEETEVKAFDRVFKFHNSFFRYGYLSKMFFIQDLPIAKISYLHEFQNLYYLLTGGQEIEIKVCPNLENEQQ